MFQLSTNWLLRYKTPGQNRCYFTYNDGRTIVLRRNAIDVRCGKRNEAPEHTRARTRVRRRQGQCNPLFTRHPGF